MFFRVHILADDRQLLHVEAVLLKFADRFLGLVVRVKNSDDRVFVGLHLLPYLSIQS